MKLPGVISLRNDLPIWAMPNGGLRRDESHDVEEVEEDALRGLRAQVVQAGLVLDDAEEGLEQAGELARLGPLATGAAVGADDLGERDVVGVDDVALAGPLLRDGLLEVVGAEPLVAREALDERVAERRDVARRNPGLPRQDDRGVQADDVVALDDHRLPPLPLDVVLQLHTERAVVPRRPGASVDLTARVHEASALAEAHDGVDGGAGGGQTGHSGQGYPPPRARLARVCVERPRWFVVDGAGIPLAGQARSNGSRTGSEHEREDRPEPVALRG